MSDTWLWLLFAVPVLTVLLLDNLVFHKKDAVVGLRPALAWSGVYIVLALLYGVAIIFRGPGPEGAIHEMGYEGAMKYLAAYLMEESLSVDNLFVFILLFDYFHIKPKYQHRILFWGIFGAVVLRVIFIVAGVWLTQKFAWIMYAFGAFLIFTGAKMFFHKSGQDGAGENWLVRIASKVIPVTNKTSGHDFFMRIRGSLHATPLFVALLAVESSDVAFAVDSIPAVLGITQDKLIIITSNLFAIMGLRNLYFALAGIMPLFRFLSFGLAAILVFIGVKMIAAQAHWFHLPIPWALGILVSVLGCCVAASLLFPAPKVRGRK